MTSCEDFGLWGFKKNPHTLSLFFKTSETRMLIMNPPSPPSLQNPYPIQTLKAFQTLHSYACSLIIPLVLMWTSPFMCTSSFKPAGASPSCFIFYTNNHCPPSSAPSVTMGFLYCLYIYSCGCPKWLACSIVYIFTHLFQVSLQFYSIILSRRLGSEKLARIMN